MTYLTPRELDVLARRRSGETYLAIAQAHNVTRARIQAIYNQAIDKLVLRELEQVAPSDRPRHNADTTVAP